MGLLGDLEKLQVPFGPWLVIIVSGRTVAWCPFAMANRPLVWSGNLRLLGWKEKSIILLIL